MARRVYWFNRQWLFAKQLTAFWGCKENAARVRANKTLQFRRLLPKAYQ